MELDLTLKRTGHPRLLLDETGFEQVRKVAQSPMGRKMAAMVIRDADYVQNLVPKQLKVADGRRMGDFHLSRWIILASSLAYMLTQDAKYSNRAIREMLHMATCTPTWNPSHYLDVSEACTGLALAYDWLYDLLSDNERNIIKTALIEKAVKTAFLKDYDWIDGYNNWVQICHTGMTVAALAVYEDIPDLAQKTVARALQYVPKIMKKSYSPCGTYPESPGYWGYGTLFNSILIGCLDTCYGSSFGLDEIPGWSETASYSMITLCPDGGYYTYSDAGFKPGCQTANLYLMKRFNRPDLYSKPFAKVLNDYCDGKPEANDLVLGLLYADILPEQPVENSICNYNSTNESLSPLAVHTSGWDCNAAYLGIRGGTAGNSHGHMDAGSFFYLSDGVRWADDPCGPRYQLEQKVDLWTLTQDSERWTVFKTGIFSHNILVFDDQNQRIAGRALIESFDEQNQCTVMNLDDTYATMADKVRRTLQLKGKNMSCHDLIEGAKPGSKVRWQICTLTDAEITPEGVLLSKDGKKLLLKADLPQNAQWELVPGKDLIKPFDDEPDAALKMVRLTRTAPADGKLEFQISFTRL